MPVTKLSYKGEEITLDQKAEDQVDVTIAGKTISCRRYGGALPMWSCDHAYFSSPDLRELARHLVDYWYIITSPTTAPPEGPGHGQGGGSPSTPGHKHEEQPRRRG